jgi:hypothetical protein
MRILRRLLVAVPVALGAFLLNAQTNVPGTYADAHNPAGPAGPAKVTQVWKVDPISGSLSINIPILSVAKPGRGPSFPYGLRYNSASTVSLSSSILPPQGSYDPSSGHQEFLWTAPLPNQQGPPGPWSENFRMLTSSSTAIPSVASHK